MSLIGKSLITVLTKMTNTCKPFKRSFTVCVEGNIGSGKTTFLNYFKKFTNTTVLVEPIELWRDVNGTNLLEMMYKDPVRYGFLFQSYVQLTMLQLHTCKTPYPYKIMERSAYSGRCFIENMKRTKLLKDVEIVVFEDWYEWYMNTVNVETDLIVYLRTSPETVYQRMKKRARSEEKCLSLEYLKQIHSIHEEWLYHQTLFHVPAPVVVLDGNRNIEDMVLEFEKCKEQIYNERLEGKLERENAANSAKHSLFTLPKIKTETSD